MGKIIKAKVAKQKPAKKIVTKAPITTTIQIKEYLAKPVSQKQVFYKFIDDAIKYKTKLHIKAPTGAGKNVLAKNYIKDHKKQDVIYVIPQISIGTQFRSELAKISITALEYNYDVRKKGSIIWPKGRKVIMSTLDSLQYLVNESWFNMDTLIFIDETHTALQSFRKGFSHSIKMIKPFAIVGFSATPSVFVNEHILDFDKEVDVVLKNPKQVIIQPLYVHKRLNELVANECVESAKDKLVIVFVNEKRQMTAIMKKILDIDDRLKVEIFNADTKTKTPYWNKLMKDEVIDPKINVVLLNAVANAGVNIKNLNSEISQVILVGKFDPLGFLQYLGRPRNYTKDFYYVFNADGKKPQPFKLATIQKAQAHAKIIREQNKKAKDDGIEFFNCKTKSSDIDISEDRLLIAHEHYRDSKAELRGDELCMMLQQEASLSNISFRKQKEVTDEEFKIMMKVYRNKKNQNLIDFISDESSYASLLDLHIKWTDTSWQTVRNRINTTPYYNSIMDKVHGRYLKNALQRKILSDRIDQILKTGKLINTVKTAIMIARTSSINKVKAKEKTEFVLKATPSKISSKYTPACQIYSPGHKTLVEQDLIHIHEHFQSIILDKRKFPSKTDIKNEINIGSYSNFDSKLLGEIFNVMFKTTRTDNNTKHLVKEVRLYLNDFIKASDWQTYYNKNIKPKPKVKATVTSKPKSITKPKAITPPKPKVKTKPKL